MKEFTDTNMQVYTVGYDKYMDILKQNIRYFYDTLSINKKCRIMIEVITQMNYTIEEKSHLYDNLF